MASYHERLNFDELPLEDQINCLITINDEIHEDQVEISRVTSEDWRLGIEETRKNIVYKFSTDWRGKYAYSGADQAKIMENEIYKKAKSKKDYFQLILLKDRQYMWKIENLLFSPEQSQKRSVDKYIGSLVHSTHCNLFLCNFTACRTMKANLMHMKSCERKADGGCQICKQLLSLFRYHAKNCNEQICIVPFCQKIKEKLQYRLQQQPCQAPEALPINVQESVALQNEASQKQPNQQLSQNAPMSTYANAMRFPNSYQMVSQSPMQGNQQMGIPANNPQMGMVRAGGAVANMSGMVQLGPNNVPQKQAVQQLIQTLKNNPGPEQKEKLLRIFKENPQFKAAFIKQRQQNQMNNQQQLNVSAAES